MRSALLVPASVGALALCVLAGCATVSPRTAAEEHEVTPSDQTGQQATGVSQQDVITTIKGLQAVSLPLLIQDHGIDRGLAEFKKRIEVVLRAIIIVSRSPLEQEAVGTAWDAYWRGEYERVANLARQGNAEAQYTLALYYGLYAPRDHAKAAEWLLKSAKQDHPQAQLILGHERYFRQDYADAVKWYRLAAEQGDAAAQSKLGDMYANGEGVPQVFVKAHMWLNLAAANLHPGDARDKVVKLRDKVAARMTADHVAEAQRMAREWLAKHGTGGQQ